MKSSNVRRETGKNGAHTYTHAHSLHFFPPIAGEGAPIASRSCVQCQLQQVPNYNKTVGGQGAYGPLQLALISL